MSRGRLWLRRAGLKAWRAAARLGLKTEHVPPEGRFHAMTQSTQADWTGILIADAAYARRVVDRLLILMKTLEGGPHGFAVDRLRHCLQAGTRAYRDGRDDAYVACALLHDIGATVAPHGHGAFAGMILKPYVSEADHWMLVHHEVFQGYYFAQHIGEDPQAREILRGHPHFERTAQFCHLYDQCAFDPNYRTMPLEAFIPTLRRVFARPRP